MVLEEVAMDQLLNLQKILGKVTEEPLMLIEKDVQRCDTGTA